jgi:hypothetical protein
MAASCFDTISPNLYICPDCAQLLNQEGLLRRQLEVTRDFKAALELAQLALALQRTRHAHEETCETCRRIERQVA